MDAFKAKCTHCTQCKYSTLLLLIDIEDLCAKRDDLHKQILEEEEEKRKIQNDIRILTERLSKVNESLSKKMASRNEFDRTIAETEAAYMKVGTSKVCILWRARPILPGIFAYVVIQ